MTFYHLCRFLKSKPQTPSPIPNSLSGLEDQQSPRANQAPPSPFDWSSFLCAAMKQERLKTNASCLAITEAEQQELYETIKHALRLLRKHKVSVTSTSAMLFLSMLNLPPCLMLFIFHKQLKNLTVVIIHFICKILKLILPEFLSRVPFRNNTKRLQQWFNAATRDTSR